MNLMKSLRVLRCSRNVQFRNFVDDTHVGNEPKTARDSNSTPRDSNISACSSSSSGTNLGTAVTDSNCATGDSSLDRVDSKLTGGRSDSTFALSKSSKDSNFVLKHSSSTGKCTNIVGAENPLDTEDANCKHSYQRHETRAQIKSEIEESSSAAAAASVKTSAATVKTSLATAADGYHSTQHSLSSSDLQTGKWLNDKSLGEDFDPSTDACQVLSEVTPRFSQQSASAEKSSIEETPGHPTEDEITPTNSEVGSRVGLTGDAGRPKLRSKIWKDLQLHEAVHILHFLHAIQGTSVLLVVIIGDPNDSVNDETIFLKMYKNQPYVNGSKGMANSNHAEKQLCNETDLIIDQIKSKCQNKPEHRCIKVILFQSNSPCRSCTNDILQFKIDVLASLQSKSKHPIQFEVQTQYICARYDKDKALKELKDLKDSEVRMASLNWMQFYDYLCEWMKQNRAVMTTGRHPPREKNPASSVSLQIQDEGNDTKVKMVSQNKESSSDVSSDLADAPTLWSDEQMVEAYENLTSKEPVSPRSTSCSGYLDETCDYQCPVIMCMNKHTRDQVEDKNLETISDVISHLYQVTHEVAVELKCEQTEQTEQDVESFFKET